MIGDTLFLSTSYNRVVALDANTGRELWSYDPQAYSPASRRTAPGFVHRGVATWTDGKQRRIFINSRWNLIALDAATGKPIRDFGDTGVVDLTRELNRNGKAVNKLHYTQTSPPVVWRDLVIVGNGVADKLVYPNDPPGDVQAFDVQTGKRVWRFSPMPQTGATTGAETWADESWQTAGHTNVWAPFSVDDRRGLDLSAGEHAEQRLVRRRAEGRQSLRRIDRLPRREERAQRSGTSRPCITVCGTTTSLRRRCWPPCGSTARPRDIVAVPDEEGFLFVFDRVDRQTDLADRGTRGAGERRARRAGVAVAARSHEAARRSPSRDSASTTSSTSRRSSKRARSTRSQDYRVGPLYTPPSLQGTIVMPGAIGGAGLGRRARSIRETGTIYIKATNNRRRCQDRASRRRSDTLERRLHGGPRRVVAARVARRRATRHGAPRVAADQQAAVRHAHRDRSQHRRRKVASAVGDSPADPQPPAAEDGASAAARRGRRAGADRHRGRIDLRHRRRVGALRASTRTNGATLWQRTSAGARYSVPMTYRTAAGQAVRRHRHRGRGGGEADGVRAALR